MAQEQVGQLLVVDNTDPVLVPSAQRDDEWIATRDGNLIRLTSEALRLFIESLDKGVTLADVTREITTAIASLPAVQTGGISLADVISEITTAIESHNTNTLAHSNLITENDADIKYAEKSQLLGLLSESSADLKYVLRSALNELLDDHIAQLLEEGSNVTITYDDSTGKLRISSVPGSTAGLLTQQDADQRYPLKSDTDPYGQYLTKFRGDAEYVLQNSLNDFIDQRVVDLLKEGQNITLTYDDITKELTVGSSITDGSGGAGGHLLKEEGLELPTRKYLNIVGDGITAEDDAANDQTIIRVLERVISGQPYQYSKEDNTGLGYISEITVNGVEFLKIHIKNRSEDDLSSLLRLITPGSQLSLTAESDNRLTRTYLFSSWDSDSLIQTGDHYSIPIFRVLGQELNNGVYVRVGFSLRGERGEKGSPGMMGQSYGIITNDAIIPDSATDVRLEIEPDFYLGEGQSLQGTVEGVQGVLRKEQNNYFFTRQTLGTTTPVTKTISTFYPGESKQIPLNIDTIAALRELAVPGIEGATRRVLGYYSVGDTEMPLYRWDAMSILTDNGGSVIRPTAITAETPGRWLLNLQAGFKAEVWGILPGADYTPRWQALAAYVNGLPAAQWRDQFGGKPPVLTVPPGEYIISGDVIFQKGIAIEGQNAVLLLDNATLKIQPRQAGTNNPSYTSSYVIGLCLVDNSASSNNKPLLEISGGLGSKVSGCLLDGKNKRLYGAYLGSEEAIWGSEISLNHFSYCQIGLRIGNDADQTHLNIFGNTIDHNTVAGLVLISCQIGYFRGNSVEWNEGDISVYCGYKNPNQFQNFTIENNYIFNNGFDTPNTNAAWGIISINASDLPALSILPDQAQILGGLTGCTIRNNKISTATAPYMTYSRGIRVFCAGAPNEINYNRLTGGGIEFSGGPAPVCVGNSDITGGTGAQLRDKTYFQSGGYLDTCQLSQTGDDNNDGQSAPVLTMAVAIARIKPGGVVNIIKGAHTLDNVSINKSIDISINSGCSCTYNNVVVSPEVTVYLSGIGVHGPAFVTQQGFIVRGRVIVQTGAFLFTNLNGNGYLFSPTDGGEIIVNSLGGLTYGGTGTKYLIQTSGVGKAYLSRQFTSTQIAFSANGQGVLFVEAFSPPTAFTIFQDTNAIVKIRP